MTADEPGELLRGMTAAFDAAGIPYMVVGSFASSIHGEPRTTRDLDIVIDPTLDQLVGFVAQLDPAKFYVDAETARDALARRGMFNIIDIETAWKIDLIIRKDRPFSITELARRARVSAFALEIETATAEDTIIAKLEWAKASESDRQLADVAGILRVRADGLDLAYIQHWVDQLGLAVLWQRVITSRSR